MRDERDMGPELTVNHVSDEEMRDKLVSAYIEQVNVDEGLWPHDVRDDATFLRKALELACLDLAAAGNMVIFS